MIYQAKSIFVDTSSSPLSSISWQKRSRQEFTTDVVLAIKAAAAKVIHAPVTQGATAKKNPTKELGDYLLKWASDTRLLREAWDVLARYGGPAAGPNGLRYSDFQGEEIWSFLKAISTVLRSGSFEPDPPRMVQIPKDYLDAAKGYRTLSILNIEDRVAQAAILMILQPLREPFLADCLYGGRRQRSRLLALADAERQTVQDKHWIWLTEDINNAFDRVPRIRLRNLLRKKIPNLELAQLIIKLAASGPKHGIHQGGPLSPYLLNEYLSRYLVEPWTAKLPDTSLFVYVDDLLTVCPTQKKAKEAWTVLRDRLQAAGFTLKGKNPRERMRDLRKGDIVDWLGFRMRKSGDKLSVQIAERSWSKLTANLHLAHDKPNSPLVATAAIEGWLDQVGPCFEFEDRDQVLDRIHHISGELAFDEIPSRPALMNRWQAAEERWQELRQIAANPPTETPLPETPSSCESWYDSDEAPF